MSNLEYRALRRSEEAARPFASADRSLPTAHSVGSPPPLSTLPSVSSAARAGLCVCVLAALIGFAGTTARATDARAGSESLPTMTTAPSLMALDAFARGEEAYREGRTGEAIAWWEEAAALDPQAVPPRLALARALGRAEPGALPRIAREIAAAALSDYRTQRWSARTVVLALALGGICGILLFGTGLVVRHIRAVHHILEETLVWSFAPPRIAVGLAWALLAVPILAGMGWLSVLVFLVCLCAFRYSRSERLLALGAVAWAILLGPVLLATAAFWAVAPDGRDALLVCEAQRQPSAPPIRDAVAGWLRDCPDDPLPRYLDGLGLKELGDPVRAAEVLTGAGNGGEIPPAVLEVAIGNAGFLAGRTEEALSRFRRAAELEPSTFEAHYNQGLVLASLGRFRDADAAHARAAELDLDRLRALDRAVSGPSARRPIDAPWPVADLWSWTLRHPAPPVAPEWMVRWLPLRSLQGAAVVLALAALLGTLAGKRLSRLLRVRVCYQCGGPVCRRCLVRVERRAYCRTCGEGMGGLAAEESTRVLIRRLLEDKPSRISVAGQVLTGIVPGFGAVIRGFPATGAIACACAGLAVALLAWPIWGEPCLPLAEERPTEEAMRFAGWAFASASIAITLLGARAAERRRSTLRAYLSRDVDRMAA